MTEQLSTHSGLLTVKQGVLHKINLYECPEQMAEGPMKSPSEECLAIDGYRGEVI